MNIYEYLHMEPYGYKRRSPFLMCFYFCGGIFPSQLLHHFVILGPEKKVLISCLPSGTPFSINTSKVVSPREILRPPQTGHFRRICDSKKNRHQSKLQPQNNHYYKVIYQES